MMPWSRSLHVGLDIGHGALKLVAESPDGTSPHRAWVRKLSGPAASGEEAALATEIGALVTEAGVRGAQVSLCLPRRETLLRRLIVPAAEGDELTTLVRFQAEREVPFPLERMALAHAILGPSPGGAGVEVVLAAVRQELVDQRTAAARSAGLQVQAVEVGPFPAVRCLLRHAPAPAGSSAEGSELTVLVDVGVHSTEIALVQNRSMVASRSGSIGLNHETAGDPVALATSVADEVSRTIHSWARDSYARPSRVVVCGGGALVDGLVEALHEKLTAPVERLEPPGADGSLPAALLACATGLVSNPADAGVPHLDLAGVEAVRREQAVRRRRVSGVAAALAATLLVILGGWYILDSRQREVADLSARLETLRPQVNAARKRGHMLATLRTWEAKRSVPLETLLELSEAIPDSAWLERLSLALDGRLRITGRASNEEAVEQLLSALSRSRLWSTARFESIRRREGSQGVEFVITARMARGAS